MFVWMSCIVFVFFFKQKTAYEMRISDWSSDVCSSDLSDDTGSGTTDSFDVEGFRRAVEIMFTGQEILVGRADYPTEAIGDTSRQFRQLGIGYANPGAMPMALGLPSDTAEGRAYAAAVTSLLPGHPSPPPPPPPARTRPFP